MVLRRTLIAMPVFAIQLSSQPVRKRSTRVRESDLESLERQIFDVVNKQRTKEKLLSLVWSDLLASEARRHSTAMVEGGFFSHRDPVRGDLEQRLNANESRIPWRRCAENIFQSSSDRNQAALAIQSWMKSPGHRRNILERTFTDAGIGVAVAEGGTFYATQIFAWLLPREERAR
jgi:uncharacterized protein YkwD